MNHKEDTELYRSCELAFLKSIARSVKACIDQSAVVSQENRQALLASLLFSLASHLSGSSHGGSVDGEEIYPVLGFSVGESDDAVYFGRGSGLHEVVASVVREIENGA